MSESCGKEGQTPCMANSKVSENLAQIKHKIVVLSGKGGVGKSTVATNLAVALSLEGCRVGLLDVDVHGPSVPRLLKLNGEVPMVEQEKLIPVPWSENLGVMSVGFLVRDDDEPVIWRGPRKTSLIEQFLREVRWGALDYLIVDCPPGTGDEPLCVLQQLQPGVQVVA